MKRTSSAGIRRRLLAPRGAANPLWLAMAASLVILGVLVLALRLTSTPRKAARGGEIVVYCAAGMRAAVEQIAAEYAREFDVDVKLQYGGSNTLLSQLEVSPTGDLFLAADESYTELARDKGLTQEEIPLATLRPVLVVASGNPKQIRGVEDLLRDDVRTALGSPDQAAVGKLTRELFSKSGQWDKLAQRVQDSGVFKPTVNDIANDVKLGSVDAGVVWDAIAAQYPELQVIDVPELTSGQSRIAVAVLSKSRNPTAALQFARYLAARDRGLETFKRLGYEPVDGDRWAETPRLTFFAGSVNRAALEPIIKAFEEREGVSIDTKYNGCGILTAEMRAIEKGQSSGFPDMYMACDVYYLDTVADLFQDAVNVSNTDIVIVVPKGNPQGIASLADLARPGMRVALGQPDQCTIGVLSRRLLESENLYDKVLAENVVTQTATSALLVPAITTGSADAVLAYTTDARGEADKVDVVAIDSPLAKAVQPYSIARSSEYKQLGRRLFKAISRSRDAFEKSGFTWRLGNDSADDTGAEGDSDDPAHDAGARATIGNGETAAARAAAP